MCSYNQINNSYGCQNSQTLNKLLKAELGFQGFVMSDWSAHHSGVGAALAGLDMSMPGDISFDDGLSFWGTNLTVSVLNGTVPAWRVDDMAVRIMTAYYKVGRDRLRIPPNFSSWTRDEYGWEHSAVSEGAWTKVNDFVNVQRSHSQIIREIGAASTVLLKNTGALPLTGKEVKVVFSVKTLVPTRGVLTAAPTAAVITALLLWPGVVVLPTSLTLSPPSRLSSERSSATAAMSLL